MSTFSHWFEAMFEEGFEKSWLDNKSRFCKEDIAAAYSAGMLRASDIAATVLNANGIDLDNFNRRIKSERDSISEEISAKK